MEGLLTFLVVLAIGGAVWSGWVEPRWFRLREWSVQVKKPLKRPITILHLSDLHFTRNRKFLSRFFDRLAEQEVDFVFVTGDLIDSPNGIQPCVRQLSKLRPRHGTFVVLGNHDHWIYPSFETLTRLFLGEPPLRERPELAEFVNTLKGAGIHVLQNENTAVSLPNGDRVVLVGIDDPVRGHARYDRAFAGIRENGLCLSLVHSPIAFPRMATYPVDAAFAGHTHGGQIRIPGIGANPLAHRVARIIETTDQYGFFGLVSRGLGAQPPMELRFLCRPEAHLVRIVGR